MACYPQGKIGPQPKPNLEHSQPASVSGQSAAALDNGLPSFCDYVIESATVSCIKCLVEGTETKRCFEVYEPIDPVRVCKFTSQRVQCLVSKGPRLIVVNLGQSLEDEFSQELLGMMETLKQVASQESRLSIEGRQKLLDILSFVERSHRAFLSDSDWIEDYSKLIEKSCQAPCVSQDVDQNFQFHLNAMRDQRATGTLSISIAMDMISGLVANLIQDPYAREIIDNINLEGLKGH